VQVPGQVDLYWERCPCKNLGDCAPK
jgi:hypothetical protein